MPEYRRICVPGGFYFFTVNLRDRRSNLLVARIDPLRAAARRTRRTRPFHIDAWVVCPTTCTRSGRFRTATQSSPAAGRRSRWRSAKVSSRPSRCRGAAKSVAKEATGKGGSGSTPCATQATMLPMSIAFTSTPSGMVWSRRPPLGHTPPFIAPWRRAAVQADGAPKTRAKARKASGLPAQGTAMYRHASGLSDSAVPKSSRRSPRPTLTGCNALWHCAGWRHMNKASSHPTLDRKVLQCQSALHNYAS